MCGGQLSGGMPLAPGGVCSMTGGLAPGAFWSVLLNYCARRTASTRKTPLEARLTGYLKSMLLSETVVGKAWSERIEL